MPASVGAAALAGTALLGLADSDLPGHLAPGCPFRAITGLDCPGCGGTRALYALTQGDVLLAADHNVITLVALPILVWAWLAWLRHRVGWRVSPIRVPPWAAYTTAGTFFVFFVLRNLPGAPFLWLASGAG